MEEASATTWRKLGGDVRTTTGGTGSILFAGMLNGSEDARTINTTTHTNDETVYITNDLDSDSDIDEVSNYYMEDSDFLVDENYVNNKHEEEDETNLTSKDFNRESQEEVVDDE